MLAKVNDLLGPVVLIWNHKLFAIGGIKLSLGNLIMALTMLLFATRLSRAASRAIDRRLIRPFVEDRSSQHTYQTFAFYGCLAGFVTLSLAVAGIPLTVFTVFGGALAIGVGFGSQNIVNNFISGIILLVEKPIPEMSFTSTLVSWNGLPK
jgi:small-conductance mechanosensitive channel